MPATPTTKAAMTSKLAGVPIRNNQQRMAYTRATKPNTPAMRPWFFRSIELAPPVRLDRAIGREKAEDDDREEVDEILWLDGALAEGIEVAHRGEIGDEIAHPAFGFAGGPADDPGHQQDHEGDQRRHHLRFGQRRDEEADGHERAAHQEQPQVTEQHRTPLDAV